MSDRRARCVRNIDCPASLDVGREYTVLEDAAAADLRFLRVIDESREDYLYPADWFELIPEEHRARSTG